MNEEDLYLHKNSLDLEQLYNDIDEQSCKFFQHHFQHYLDKNAFPEDISSTPPDIDLTAASLLLRELKWGWTESELLARLSLLGAEVGLNRPIPILYFLTLLEEKSIIWSQYCELYIQNFEFLINSLKCFIPDQDEPGESIS